jgi:hypothetical protein
MTKTLPQIDIVRDRPDLFGIDPANTPTEEQLREAGSAAIDLTLKEAAPKAANLTLFSRIEDKDGIKSPTIVAEELPTHKANTDQINLINQRIAELEQGLVEASNRNDTFEVERRSQELERFKQRQSDVLNGRVPKGMEPLGYFLNGGGDTRRSRRAERKRSERLASYKRRSGRVAAATDDRYRSARSRGRSTALKRDMDASDRSATGLVSRVGQVIKLRDSDTGKTLGREGSFVVQGIIYDPTTKKPTVVLRPIFNEDATRKILEDGTGTENTLHSLTIDREALIMHLQSTKQLSRLPGYRAPERGPLRRIRHRRTERKNKQERQRILTEGFVFEAEPDKNTHQKVKPVRWGSKPDHIEAGKEARKRRAAALDRAIGTGRHR